MPLGHAAGAARGEHSVPGVSATFAQGSPRFGPRHHGPRGPYVSPAGQRRDMESCRRRLCTGARFSGILARQGGSSTAIQAGVEDMVLDMQLGPGPARAVRQFSRCPHPPCGDLSGVWAVTRPHGMELTYSPVSELAAARVCLSVCVPVNVGWSRTSGPRLFVCVGQVCRSCLLVMPVGPTSVKGQQG